MTTITNNDRIGVTTATEYIESVESLSFVVDIDHLKEALVIADSIGFVNSDGHVRIMATANVGDGLLIQSVSYPNGSVRCACIDVIE